MSLINKMLLDLDKRGGGQVGAMPRPSGSAMGAKSASGVGSEWFWRILAVLMFVAVGWVTWLIWELRPRPVVTELAMRVPLSRTTPLPATDLSKSADTQAEQPASGMTMRDASVSPLPSQMAGLRLATELVTAPARQIRAVSRDSVAVRSSPPQTADSGTVSTQLPDIVVPPLRIDKRDTSTPRDRADAEFRRALALRSQRRGTESLEAMRMALAIDSAYESVRQSMVATLLESKQYDEAIQALNEGLRLNPANTAFTMALARISVERGDVDSALNILDRQAANALGNADYRAFRAALQQRIGRHAEAMEEYRAALAVSPGTGQWWVGLGISQQARAQTREALESFRRAKGTGTLSPELVSFVDQRISQLQ